ncbi:MAG TPA: V-type ATPase 116kDa subunit family protein [Vicinamibacterales bacterium]
MIVRMMRVRIAGPRSLLDRTLTVLQDLGVLHVDRPPVPDGRAPDRIVMRERRHVERCLSDVEMALNRLRLPADPGAPAERPLSAPQAARRARRVRRRAETLALATSALEDERSLLVRYREFFQAFEALVGHELTWPDGQAFYVVLRAGAGSAVGELRRRLEDALHGEVVLLHQELSSGEWAVLILASSRAAPKVSALLSASRVEELPAPAGIAEKNVLRALPAIKARLGEIPESLHAVDAQRRALAQTEGAWLSGLRVFLRDQLLRFDARTRVFAADYLFVIEGWLPVPRLVDLQQRMQTTLGPEVVVSTIGAEDWTAEAAPVALHNPPLFRPFEVLTRILPLPKYGTIDPTPFVAIFFPAFFGLIVGDVGHGLLLAGLAGLLRLKSEPDTTLRSVSTVALACSSSTIAFGVFFGEFFGSLGPAIGLQPFFNREQATIPFLGLSVALGGVHIALGLVLAGVSAWRRGHRREAVGRSVALGMLILTALSLLAAFEVLPAGLFTPLVVAILVAFTVLVALEGIVAVIELLSTVGHILSYARIMALGTASLMLAVVANEMVGAMGSVLVGAIFALLFHLVNFAIGLFSPTIHALRLHYVEFFGQFFSPGGAEYRPLGHWHPLP